MPSNRLLKILLIFSIILSIGITTIIVIIMARGGQINDISTSGLIRLHVNPENIEYSAYVNDKEYIVSSDKRINNLKEGTYTIRVEAENFTSWQKEISIKNDVVSDIYVKLYPLDLKLTQSTKSNIDKAIFSENGDFVYYTIINSEIGSDKGLWSLQLNDNSSIFGTTKSEAVKLLDFDSVFEKNLQSKTFEILPSPDNSKLLFIDRENELAYILDAKKKNSSPYTNIYNEIGYSNGDISWFNGGQSLIFSDKNLIFDYNTNDKTKTIVYYSDDSIISAISDTQIIILDQNKLFTYKDKKLIPLEIFGAKIPNNISKIHASEIDDVILLETNDNKIIYFNIDKVFMKEFPQWNSKMNFIEINSSADSILLKSESNEYLVFNVEENIALNTFETKLVKLNTDKSQDKKTLENIKFSAEGGHLLMIYSKENTYELLSKDKDGTNEINLIQSDGIIKLAEFNSKVSYLYLLIENKEGDKNITNIFRMNLDK